VEVVRRIAATVTMLLLTTGADVGAQNGTQHAEFWPELQFRYRIDDANSATLASRLRLTTGPAQMYRAEETLTFSHTFADWLSGGAGFEHRNSTNATPFEEERAIVNQTLRVGLPNDFRVEFRTQEEFRWLLTGFSVRLRERAQVMRTLRMEGYSFSPYVSTEVFYDSRFGSFARYRLTAGATLPVYRALSAQPYFMREVNFEGSNIIRDILRPGADHLVLNENANPATAAVAAQQITISVFGSILNCFWSLRISRLHRRFEEFRGVTRARENRTCR
jgi:hypothetical protein